MSYQEVRIDIPHPNPKVNHLASILRTPSGSLEASSPTPIALICHGIMAHKNQTYHRALAEELSNLGIPSIRWDFQANGDSPGEWSYAEFHKDIEDYDVVWAWLEERGWVPDIVIAHSRGSITANKYLCDLEKRHPKRRRPSFFVNLAGRYVMARILGRLKDWGPSFQKQGYVVVKHGKRVDKARMDQLTEFATHDTSIVITQFPKDIHVLTIHGTADEIVPFNDGEIYHLVYSSRNGSGTSEFKPIEGANHNFIGKGNVSV